MFGRTFSHEFTNDNLIKEVSVFAEEREDGCSIKGSSEIFTEESYN